MNDIKQPIKNLILDMDGVLWHGETPVPGLADFFAALKRNQIGFILATNNATKTQHQYQAKLERFGVEVNIDQILTSSEATAGHIRKTHPEWRTAYVVGELGLHQAMENHGFHVLADDVEDMTLVKADVVVAGMTWYVCYHHLAVANYLINHGAAYYGTNPDVTFPSEIGPMPGAGSILAFLETSSGKAPIVIGKPHAIMFDEAVRRLGGTRERTVMVGDRLNTDIAGAQSAGLRSILLLSGISTEEDLATSNSQPTWIFHSLKELTEALPVMINVARES
jgi:4-nitrophenyl phosphatase